MMPERANREPPCISVAGGCCGCSEAAGGAAAPQREAPQSRAFVGRHRYLPPVSPDPAHAALS